VKHEIKKKEEVVKKQPIKQEKASVVSHEPVKPSEKNN
jgi:hypothetical protein